jgi:hypothetical protein
VLLLVLRRKLILVNLTIKICAFDREKKIKDWEIAERENEEVKKTYENVNNTQSQ